MKKITINTDALRKALNKAKEVIDKKSTLSSVTNVLLQVNKTDIKLICTDIELTLIAELTCENEDSKFDVLIPFEFLHNLVSITTHSTLDIQTDAKTKVHISGLNDKTEINSLDKVKDFPKVPEFPNGQQLKINNDFIHQLNQALMTTGKDTARPVLSKVCVDVLGEQLVMVSTNANVLYKKRFDIKSDDTTPLIISPKVAKALKGFTETEICWNDSHVSFKSDNVTLIATRPDEKFVAYDSVIPEYTTNLEIDRAEMIDALSKASLVTDDTKFVKLLLKNKIGIIVVEAINLDYARNVHVDLPADFEGDCQEIAFNVDNMLKLLNQVSYEKLKIAISENNRPIILTSESDDTYLGLIMPMTI